jgi:hypothetical protein
MNVLTLIISVFISLSSTQQSDDCKDNEVSILSKKRDIFYFKLCKYFLGARVEVYDPEGKIIATEEITANKALIDFYFEKPGKYAIKFKKGNEQKDFTYNKLTPPPLTVADVDYHVVISQQSDKYKRDDLIKEDN